MRALGIGDPAAWDWGYMRSRVVFTARYRLDYLERRHRAQAAAIAAGYGLDLVVTGDGAELR